MYIYITYMNGSVTAVLYNSPNLTAEASPLMMQIGRSGFVQNSWSSEEKACLWEETFAGRRRRKGWVINHMIVYTCTCTFYSDTCRQSIFIISNHTQLVYTIIITHEYPFYSNLCIISPSDMLYKICYKINS